MTSFKPADILTPLSVVRELLWTLAASLRDNQTYQVVKDGRLMSNVETSVLFRLHPVFKTDDIIDTTLAEVVKDWHQHVGTHGGGGMRPFRLYSDGDNIFLQALEQPAAEPREPHVKAQVIFPGRKELP